MKVSHIKNNIFLNCRLCQKLPGEIKLDSKKLPSLIFDYLKIKVDDDSMMFLPQNICKQCKSNLEKFDAFSNHVKSVDQHLRTLLHINSYDQDCGNEDDELYICNKCPASLTSSSLLEDHLNSHKTGSNYQCILCMKSFGSYRNFQKHKKCCKKIMKESNSSENVCEDSSLKLKVVNEGEQFQPLVIVCDKQVDQKTCSSNTNTEYDSEGEKLLTEKQEGEEKSHSELICSREDCKKTCKTLYALKTHELRHEGKRPFLCVTCGKNFVTKNSLTCHEKIHLDVKGYVCKLCNIEFSVRSNLRSHEKKHHEGIKFYCSQCTKSFLNKCSLERHEKTHSGIKEFKCDSCKAAFYTNKELLNHRKYHQGLKQHKCEHCFKTFFERHHLTIHLRIHSGEKPYVCGIQDCKKSFTESQKLKKHQNTKHAQIKR